MDRGKKELAREGEGMENKNTFLAEAHPMVAGEGPQSYVQNSSFQKKVVEDAKELIHEAVIDNFDLENSNISNNTIRIADLGCSVGPNTFIAVQNIIEAIEFKYQKSYKSNKIDREFQVFFNDHADNDFNTLFRLLPPSRNYFANVVPGSFHGRIFPKSSLHIVHSSSALHWLSKVPEVADSKSLAWNKGSIICTGLVKEVVEAYSNQFKNDMETFLTARAQEIVGGGLMVLLLPGLADGVLMSQTVGGMIYELLWSCLDDHSKLGLIKQENVNSFNLPLYFANAKEVVGIVEGNGYFSIEKIQELNKYFSTMGTTTIDMQSFITSNVRAVVEGVMKEHFGHKIVDELFRSFPKKLDNCNFISDDEFCKDVDLFILLKRKVPS